MTHEQPYFDAPFSEETQCFMMRVLISINFYQLLCILVAGIFTINNNPFAAPSSEHTWLPPTFPISCIPLLLVSTLEFYQGVDFVVNEANKIFRQFLEASNTSKEAIKVA